MPPSPRSPRERRLRPPAIKSGYSKAQALRKEKSNVFTRAFYGCVCTRLELLINTVGEKLVKPVIWNDV